MNFERDHTGVAVKFRRKGDLSMITKTGNREQALAHVWEVPEGHELIGFHGGMNAEGDIVELGIVTRVATFPSMCLDGVNAIAQSVEKINAFNGFINAMNTDIQGQAGTLYEELNTDIGLLNT